MFHSADLCPDSSLCLRCHYSTKQNDGDRANFHHHLDSEWNLLGNHISTPRVYNNLEGIHRPWPLGTQYSSLPLLALTVGILIGVFPHIWDVHKLREKERQRIQIELEDTIMGSASGTPALAAGLWWFYPTTSHYLSDDY